MFNFFFRAWIPYTDMYEMLRNMEPPVGFGKKCPYRLAYRVIKNNDNKWNNQALELRYGKSAIID